MYLLFIFIMQSALQTCFHTCMQWQELSGEPIIRQLKNLQIKTSLIPRCKRFDGIIQQG
jgi:hypothetical protein